MPPVDIDHTAKPDNEQFWKEVYLSYFDALVYYAYYFVGDWENAEDIVSEVFAGMIISCKDFRNKTATGSYFYTSVKHACFKHLGKEKKVASKKTELAICFPDIEERSVVLLHEALRIQEVLEKMMEPLNPNEHAIIRMFYLEKQSITQIAEVLETTENSIRVQKSKAISKIRKKNNGLPESLLYSMFVIMSGLAS